MKLVALLTGTLLSVGVANAQNPEQSWDNLKQLRAGQKIQVIDMKLKSTAGEFGGLSDETLSLRRGKDEITFARRDVLRVGLQGADD